MSAAVLLVDGVPVDTGSCGRGGRNWRMGEQNGGRWGGLGLNGQVWTGGQAGEPMVSGGEGWVGGAGVVDGQAGEPMVGGGSGPVSNKNAFQVSIAVQHVPSPTATASATVRGEMRRQP